MLSRYVLVTVFSVLLAVSFTYGTTYNGSLIFEDDGAINTGLDVASANTNGWRNYTHVDWFVSDEELGAPATYPWYYEYTVTVRKYELSHLIIELSDNFGANDITQIEVNGSPHSDISIGTQMVNAGSPRMPEDMYGIKFDGLGDGYEEDDSNVTHVISFFSDRAPVWGDGYFKCGGFGNNAFNEGFTINDVDPLDGPSDGSIDMHLLVPDSVVPEPATLGLLALGAMAAICRRTR